MKFTQVLSLLKDLVVGWRGKGDPEIKDLEIHSAEVKPGDIFICRKGERFDSHQVVWEVVKKGAVALICERPVGGVDVPFAVVSDSRIAEAILADAFYGSPYRRLITFGVTGTNGKTTTVRMIHFLLKRLGLKGSVVSTVGNEIAGRIEKTENTTPSALYIFRRMKETVERRGEYFVLEISSHALAQGRVFTVKLDSAGLTNITRDHLDFHGSFEEYMRVKFTIFDLLKGNGVGVINSNFISHFKSKRFRKVFYGRSGDYVVENIQVSLKGTKFDLLTPKGRREVSLKVVGDFNAYNATLAIAMLTEVGFDIDELVEEISRFTGVDGRFEPVKDAEKAGLKVFVDFAHSPDALEKAIKTAKKLTLENGRVIVVFGAGGMSDKGKRKMMGEIAARLADISILTNDDPRGEDPREIIEDVLEGFGEKEPLVIEDRREAIETALTLAGKRDVVLIAGRGHEEYQVFSDDRKIPFKDAEVVREIVRRKLKKR